MDVMRFSELKLSPEKWRKGDFDINGNDVKQGITVFQINVNF